MRSNRTAFTLIELVCTVVVILIICAQVLSNFADYKREKTEETRAEMLCIADELEQYHDLFGDYPHIAEHDDKQCEVLLYALDGKIDPYGNEVESESLIAHDFKFLPSVGIVDKFNNCYIYYYKLRSSPTTWTRPSYVLISLGARGVYSSTKNVTVSTSGEVTGDLKGDIVLTNGGFL